MDPEIKDVFFEIHSGLPREGPGCFEATQRALQMLDLPECPAILDAGCGPGQQTLDLASLSSGRITALDNHQPYLDTLEARVRAQGKTDRITTCLGDMAELPFAPASFDVIWSEGAIYLIGFQEGLELWKSFLKPGSFVAVTEITWLRPDPPSELAEFWRQAYPPMADAAENASRVSRAGYDLLGHFPLPHSAWWDDYYSHIEAKLPSLRDKYHDQIDKLEVIAMEAAELDLHRRYADYYGYVFYVMRRS
ncbi:MAG: class I SAM-dependent methyltransferase [Candidatus Aminicenantaceae bacterium]